MIKYFLFLARLLFVFMLFTFSATLLSAQSPSPGVTEMLRNDSRLAEKRVTVYLPYASIGEVLEQWSAQTGISIAPDERDGSRDVLICVLVKDLPLRNAMDALWSLLSYKKAEWIWERVGDSPEAYRYVLHQTPSAHSLAEKVANEVQNDFEKHAVALIAAARLPPEQQKKIGEQDPILGPMLSRPELRRGVLAFANSLTQDQQRQLLQNHMDLKVDVAKLSPEGQQLASDYMAHIRLLNPNALYNDPTQVLFSVSQTDLTPELSILVGTGNNGFEGYPYIGTSPFDDDRRAKIMASWILPNDVPTEKEIEVTSISKEAAQQRPEVNALLSEMDPATKRGLNMYLNYSSYLKELTPTMRLVQLAAATGIPILARVSQQIQGSPAINDIKSPYGKTMSKFLLTADAYLTSHKWRDGVLLLTSHRRLVEKQSREYPSWPLLKETREALKENQDGTLSLAAMTQIVSHYSHEQLVTASSLPSYRSLKTAAALAYPLLKMIGRRPEILKPIASSHGIADAEATQIVAKMFQLSDETLRQSKGRIIRIREGTGDVPLQLRGQQPGVIPTRAFIIELLTQDGSVVKSVSIQQTKDMTPEAYKASLPALGRYQEPF